MTDWKKISTEEFVERTQTNLLARHHCTMSEATAEQLHDAIGQTVLEYIARPWHAFEEQKGEQKQACYLSAEYLTGRQVYNNLFSLGILDEVKERFAALGAPLEQLEDLEDAALGNGGLGRLAACYLDSAASENIVLTGYGLQYRFGLFRQSFENFCQKEEIDDWNVDRDPWSIRRDDLTVTVQLRDLTVHAVPYDMPVIGYGDGRIGTLRLWRTESVHELDFELFGEAKYIEACKEKNRAEDIVKLLYPNDNTRQGKIMRIKQQYVLSSASVQDMLRSFEKDCLKKGVQEPDYADFPNKYAIQLNDTHPVMAIPEFIHLLMEKGVSFEDAFAIAQKTFAYTNHTVMREALEVWDVKLMNAVAPHLVQVIQLIENRLHKDKDMKKLGLTVMAQGKIHMADLAVYACHSVNGVAKIHSEILKTDVFSDWYTVYPERFCNVTNGITQRRWLAVSNPELTNLLTRTLGSDAFLSDLSQLANLRDKIDDNLCQEFLAVRQEKKRQLIEYIGKNEGVQLDASFLFDSQIKRLHEYKRQLLNAFCILAMYKELKAGNLPDFQPMVCLMGGKAFASYQRARAVVCFVNQIAAMVNADPETNSLLRVVFVQNYNCSYAERIIPASDLSEQISTAGTEASGTSNMKFMLNGALTLGTMDGANIEIVAQAGKENNFIFGATVEEIEACKEEGAYDSKELYDSDPLLRAVVDTLDDGTFQDPDGSLAELKTSLLEGASWHKPDHYFVFKDFRDYYNTRLEANRSYADKLAFARKALMNISGAGPFSSDRSVREYAKNIWDMQ